MPRDPTAAACRQDAIDRETHLLRQTHQAKLATDVLSGLVSTALMWRRRPPGPDDAYADGKQGCANRAAIDLLGAKPGTNNGDQRSSEPSALLSAR